MSGVFFLNGRWNVAVALVVFLAVTRGSAPSLAGSLLSQTLEHNHKILGINPKKSAPPPNPNAKKNTIKEVEDAWDMTCATLDMSHHDLAPTLFTAALRSEIPNPLEPEERPPQLELIIHKASEGLDPDKKYAERQRLASGKGFLWGAFHFPRADIDPVQQADYFLDTIRRSVPDKSKEAKALLILDLEHRENTGKLTISVKDGARFIQRVKEVTGVFPGVYVAQEVLKDEIARLHPASDDYKLYSQCWLWVPRYGDIPPIVPQGLPWRRWTMWQFTADKHFPKPNLYPAPKLPGIERPELNWFRGNRAYLTGGWYKKNAWVYYNPTKPKARTAFANRHQISLAVNPPQENRLGSH